MFCPISSGMNYSYLPLPIKNQHQNMPAATKLWIYFRRIFKFDQMDFEFAFWQMVYLFIAPQKVFQNFHHRKQSKAQFARDDPAFLVLFTGCLFVTSVGFALVLYLTIWELLLFLLYVIFIDCIGGGLITATVFWYVLNKYFRLNMDQDVEWGFAFDVHLNALFPSLILLHFCQLLLFNGLFKINEGWFISTCVGNTFWLIAVNYYVYITFLGYRSLQILQRPQLLLIPIPVIILLYFVSLVGNCNITYLLLRFYKKRIF